MRNRIILGVCILALLILIVSVVVSLLHKDKKGNSESALQTEAASEENALGMSGSDGLVINGDGADSQDVESNAGADSQDAESEAGAESQDAESNAGADSQNGEAGTDEAEGNEEIPPASDKDASQYAFYESESTSEMTSEEVASTYCILTSVDNHSVVSARNAYTRINPASMTKVLTLLVACENLTDLDDEVTITIEATDYAYANDGSAVGFAIGEKVPVKDLLYGTILPSGADAAYALACYIAGSQEAFVEMMNEKLEKLGLSENAHFTNCVGLYDENHYCRAYDIAVIMEAAMENSLCREVLSAHRYTTTATTEHPDGIELSNLFLRRIEDRDTLGEVIGAKTGFVNQSRNCAVSYYTCKDGGDYICVTADGANKWRCIYDHVAVYNIYAAGNTEYKKQ